MAIELVVNDDSIDLTFTGVDRFLALSKGIHLPITEITDARVADGRRAEEGPRAGASAAATGRGAWRPATSPGADASATASSGPCTGDKEVLVIDTTRENPARIVLQHPYRHDLAWLIAERIPPRRTATTTTRPPCTTSTTSSAPSSYAARNVAR